MAKHQLLRFVCLVAIFPAGLAASSLSAAETAEELFHKAVELSASGTWKPETLYSAAARSSAHRGRGP